MKTENKVFTIYHVPGVKIGCTDNLRRRLRVQGLLDSEWEILETHTDDQIASKREKELQKQYGYPVDRNGYEFETRSRVGKIGGKKNIESGHLDRLFQKNKESGVLEKCSQRTKELYSKPVLAFRKDTGEFVGEFESQKEAARQLNLYQGTISNIIRGIVKSTGGYTFRLAPK